MGKQSIKSIWCFLFILLFIVEPSIHVQTLLNIGFGSFWKMIFRIRILPFVGSMLNLGRVSAVDRPRKTIRFEYLLGGFVYMFAGWGISIFLGKPIYLNGIPSRNEGFSMAHRIMMPNDVLDECPEVTHSSRIESLTLT